MILHNDSRYFNRRDDVLAGTGNPESQSINLQETIQWDTLEKVLNDIKRLSADHDLDGGIAIRLRDLVILHNEIYSLRERLRTQKAGVREVIKAAVDLVCSPEWVVISDEEEAIERALRKAGFVMPIEEALRKVGFVASNEKNNS